MFSHETTFLAGEETRLKALADYHLLDTPPEPEFDRLVELASRVFDAPIAVISLLDRSRVFFKARVGTEIVEADRRVSFCAKTLHSHEPLVVLDATKDPRFAQNELVLNAPWVRFYAGAPLRAPSGHTIGVLCIVDSRPRSCFSVSEQKNLVELAAVVMDRMEVRRLEYARKTSQARFENIAATSPDAIVCSGMDSLITFWNRAAEEMFGYSAEEAIGQPVTLIIPPERHRLYYESLVYLAQGRLNPETGSRAELPALRRDGTRFPAEFAISVWADERGMNAGAIIRDVSEQRDYEERLRRLAMHDALTGLPNRLALERAIKDRLGPEGRAALLLIDLDCFKDVNDTLGHAAGDDVLRQVAARLSQAARADELIARLSGDEFVVLLPSADPLRARNTAEMLKAAIAEPFVIDDETVHITVSIGLALAPLHGIEARELVSSADLAMYKAKSEGRARTEVFTPQLRQAAIARRHCEEALRRAFTRHEFELYYQPQVDLRDGSITGVEALLRWNHPENGLLAPGAFIHVLEKSPLAKDVGDWILHSACRQVAEWRRAGAPLRVGVNLFDAQLTSEHLLASVKAALDTYHLEPQALELEITETTVLNRDGAAIEPLRHLREIGVGVAFDDYGTGFASLSLLKDYPLSRLKIDQSFVRDLCTDPKDAAVVEAIILLGERFGLRVIAEGVETAEQRDFLLRHQCDEAQGYFIGRPVPAADFAARFLARASRRIA
ncbi:sensor domain-containing phosphodiesterase [Consotaella salsifontis]|uniref:PAS domain S-box-containing protein/diguanylate cyclase (GGDEF) domain-containing protein n=1 Tax=Consotaella salsifontis TaxID=1365950 RepID=A0A1T4SDE3_9HYPH|nr:EAL domain-containing protein [Consotaella salsifontis]SKA26195.1 PAS domain S-box-containing protein/diguanylate cyclase (GGDEF) domain-containing protein [Consotaella salsifontis]